MPPWRVPGGQRRRGQGKGIEAPAGARKGIWAQLGAGAVVVGRVSSGLAIRWAWLKHVETVLKSRGKASDSKGSEGMGIVLKLGDSP